ncbi:MAG: type VI secretion system baseplate subunit TssG [Pseudomonadota bacterium]
MPSQERSAGSALTHLRALKDTPRSHHVFQALRLIEAAHQDAPRLGTSRRPSEDPVRLGQDADLAFPTSTVSDVAEDPETGRLILKQKVFGLFGPNGALPLHLTEHARDRSRNHGDSTFGAFADIFHHRMLSLFYRAWASGQPAPSFDRPGDDPFGDKIAALSGFAGEAFEDRDAMPDLAKRHFSGLLAAGPKSEAGLKAIVSRFFKADVQIESFVGSWLHLEPHDRGRLGGMQLGRSASIGTKVWSRDAKFRIRIGPLSLSDYERLLPGGQSFKRLRAIVRNYVGDTLDWDVNLVLHQNEVPKLALGRSGRLGLTAWIGTHPLTDADDLCVHAMASDASM